MGRLLVIGAISWPLLLGLAVWTRHTGRAPLVSAVIYAAASRVCHQRPDRSFFTEGIQWPVCGRGAGLYLLGEGRKALVFFGVLIFMYVIGVALGGRLFPFQFSEPLVFLSALAEWVTGLPRLTALVGGFGQGDVVATSYEYGNTFL